MILAATNKSSSVTSTGKRLLAYIRARGISREKLAELAGISANTVYRICAGDRVGTIGTWMRIADALDCSINDIIKEDESDDGRN